MAQVLYYKKRFTIMAHALELEGGKDAARSQGLMKTEKIPKRSVKIHENVLTKRTSRLR